MDMLNQPQSIFDVIDALKRNGIPEKEYKRHINYYLDTKARKNRIPLHGSFELTPLCNLDCKMCYIHLNNSQFNIEDLLSVDEWKSIMKQSHEAGMIKATLTGGECLTYPGFNVLYAFLYNMGITPSLMSNGVLMNKEQIEFFKCYPPKSIQISLYGSSEDAYERVTGKRVFNTVYNNLERLKEANLPVRITITPNRFMVDDIHQLLEVSSSLNIPFYINSRLITPRENTGRALEDMSIEQYVLTYKIQRELIGNDETESYETIEIPEENHEGISKRGLQCGGGRSSFNIKYDGSMSPCASLYDLSADTLKMGFLDAWKYINHLADNYPMPEECDECVYHDYCLLCPAIHKNANRIGHCDSKVCERTKRLVQQGIIKIGSSTNR